MEVGASGNLEEADSYAVLARSRGEDCGRASYLLHVCVCVRERETGRQRDIHTYIHTYIHTERQTDRQTDRLTDRQSGKVGVGEAGWGGEGRETDMERAVRTGQARTRGKVPHLRGLASWEDHE